MKKILKSLLIQGYSKSSIRRKYLSGANLGDANLIGKVVKVDNFDIDRWNECSTGIHFFMNRQMAINYNN